MYKQEIFQVYQIVSFFKARTKLASQSVQQLEFSQAHKKSFSFKLKFKMYLYI